MCRAVFLKLGMVVGRFAPEGKWILAGTILSLVVFVVFVRVLSYPILRWDDAMHILENPYLYLPMSAEKFASLWRFPYFGLYIPMTYTLWGLLKIWTLEPLVFHALNLLLHICNGVLILWIMNFIGVALVPAVIGTAFFLLHPLAVEPVAWISGLKDVGAMFFGLLAMRIALSRRIHPWIRNGLAFFCYGLSIMSKPSGVVFPILTGLLMVLAAKKQVASISIESESVAGASKEIAPNHIMQQLRHGGVLHALSGFLLISPIIFVSMYLQPSIQIQEYTEWWKRPVIAVDAVYFYVSKILVPWELLPDYARTPSVVWNDKSFWSLTPGLLVIALPFILWRQAFVLSIGLMLFLVGLAPNLGLIPFAFQDHSTVADRYAYVALFGVALVVAWLSRLKWVRMTLIILLSVLGFLSFRQVALWQDQVSLFTSVLEVNPRSVVALDGLGVDAYRRGDMVRAEDLFRRALAVNPRASRSWFNVGSVLWLKGDIKGATEALETSLKLDPNHPDTLNNLGFVYAGVGKDQAAESLFRRALYVNRLDLDARYNLAQLMHKQGKAEESVRLLDEAMTINPAFAEKYFGKKSGP